MFVAAFDNEQMTILYAGIKMDVVVSEFLLKIFYKHIAFFCL